MAAYVPAAGDLVWITFDPQAGLKQAGRRPALVLSPHSYNSKSGIAVMCPIKSRSKNYPFEVKLPPGLPVAGVILSDHLKSLDWRSRRAEFIGQLPSDSVGEVLDRISPLLGFINS